MIQLLIDGKKAVIKKGVNLQLTFENSYFSKGNVWSYDIELPLDDYHNAAIFGAIGRHDVRQKQQTHTAELIIPGMNHITGSVVVTKITETSVYVQLTVNNTAIDSAVADRYIDSIYELGRIDKQPRAANYPVSNTDGEVIGDYVVRATAKNDTREVFDYGVEGTFEYELQFIDPPLYYPYQPYFFDVVMKLLQVAGYTVGTNALDTQMMRALIIVRATTQKNIASHLPHWTFSEFITEVELFAGVHFIFDNTTKVVDIVSVSVALTDSTSTTNNDVVVVDELSAEIDTDTASVDAADTNGNNNIGYDLLGDFSDKYEKLSDEILDAANITPVDSWDEMKKMHDDGTDNQKQLFLLDGDYYLPQPKSYPFKCNRLHDIKTNDDTDVQLLRITPVAFTEHTFDIYDCTGDEAIKRGVTQQFRIMVSEGRNPSGVIDSYLVNTITGNEDDDYQDEGSYHDVMRVAFVDELKFPIYMEFDSFYPEEVPFGFGMEKKYEGFIYKAKLFVNTPYTMPGFMRYDRDNYIDSATRVYFENHSRGDEDTEYEPYERAIDNRPYTLELTGCSATGNGTISIKRLLPDKTIEYTKRIIAYSLPDVNKIFQIRGKRFICKSLTVEINEEGIVPLMEGTFYMFD